MIRYSYIFFFSLIISCSPDRTLKEEFIPKFRGFPPTNNIVILNINSDSIMEIENYIDKLFDFEAEVVVLAGVLHGKKLKTQYLDSIFYWRNDIIQVKEMDEDRSVFKYANFGSFAFNLESFNDTLKVITSFDPVSFNDDGDTIENIALKTVKEFYPGLYYKREIKNRISIKFYGGRDAYHLINTSDIDWIVRDKIVIVSMVENEKSYYTPHGLIYSEGSNGFIEMKMKQSYILANMINTLVMYTPEELGLED